MIRKVKRYRAGFVVSDSNVSPDMTLQDVLLLTEENRTFYSGSDREWGVSGKLLGIVTNKDYRVSRMDPNIKVKEFMTQIEKIGICS